MVKRCFFFTLLTLAMVVLQSSTIVLGENFHGGFRAFYFMQQWLGSYCNQRGTTCCYPATGKPTPDFTVNGLWPYFNDGSFAYNCGDDNYNVTLLKPIEASLQQAWPSFTCPLIGRKFWVHEWNKHGTCTKSILGELDYFNAAITMKKKVNIFQALANVGIKPSNDKFYALKTIKQAINRAVGYRAWVVCNTNSQGHSQIWTVSVCVDSSGVKLIDCPTIPQGRGACANNIQYPA